jgi:O-antigen ligase
VAIAAATGTALLLAGLPAWGGKLQPWADWLAAACVFLIGAVAWATAGRLRPGTPLHIKLLAVSLLLLCPALFASVAPYEGVRIALLFSAAVALLAVCMDVPSVATAARWAVAAGGALAGLWGLREYLFTWAITGDSSWRPFAGFLNPNALAGYLLVAVPALDAAAVSLWRQAQGKQPGHPARVLWLITALLAGLATAAFLFTGSKGALVGAFAAAGLTVVVRTKKRLPLAAALAVAVAVILLLPPVRNRVRAAFSSQRGTSLAFRSRTWAGTVDMALARPVLGWGPGSFKHVYPRFARVAFTASAHNSWLQWAAESGFPAAVVLLAALVALACALARTPGPWATAGLFGLVAVAIHNLFDYTWYLPPVSLALFALVGAALADQTPPAAEAEEHPLGRPGLLIAAVLCLGILTSAWFCSAEVDRGRAEKLVLSGFGSSALDVAEHAADRAAIATDLWVQVGKIAESLASAARDASGLVRAAEAYAQSVRVCPTEPSGYIGAARCLREAGRPAEALTWACGAATVYPHGPAALLEYARCQEAVGDVPRALEAYRATMALADADYGRYAPLEGWADYHLAVAAAAVGRASQSPDERLHAWRVVGQVLAAYLQWTATYHASLELGGQIDKGRQAELCSLALEGAAALSKAGQAGDDALAAKLRTLAGR